MIKFENVTKKFGSTVALEDISFEIEKGEFVFLTGHSGSGKTTLIRLLLRELSPTSGKILIEGKELGMVRKHELPFYRRKVGVVFQDFKLLSNMTVYENVRLACEIDGHVSDVEEKKIQEVLHEVGMTAKQGLFPRQLSGGETQRAVIARVLVMQPKVILADEPTGNLDPQTARQIIDLLEKASEGETTVLVATHNALIVNDLKRRVIQLKEGKLVGDCKKGKYID
ncbi:MAG: ATP-binding cassette domain-containing protein [Candidatus Blackburnbacteria bacterium]|nr:ATP-binding cassette domain-containing protein [Candidatus Blackburnbacteria bacterium]